MCPFKNSLPFFHFLVITWTKGAKIELKSFLCFGPSLVVYAQEFLVIPQGTLKQNREQKRKPGLVHRLSPFTAKEPIYLLKDFEP